MNRCIASLLPITVADKPVDVGCTNVSLCAWRNSSIVLTVQATCKQVVDATNLGIATIDRV